MQQQEIHNFLTRFFTVTNCEVTTDTSSIHSVLTIEMDKLLMKRPFYWHYLEKTGGIPNPSTLNLTIEKTDNERELIHFGSPKLRQIFDVITKLGRHIRLYQLTLSNQEIPLIPYVMINGTISYVCNQKREIIYSYGLNLLTGEMIDNFFHKINSLHLTPKIPDYCYTLSPLITVRSGINRIQDKIKNDLQNEEHLWANNSKKQWAKDLSLLDKFFSDNEELPESYFIEKEALQHQYDPFINVSTLNGGLIYLVNTV